MLIYNIMLLLHFLHPTKPTFGSDYSPGYVLTGITGFSKKIKLSSIIFLL